MSCYKKYGSAVVRLKKRNDLSGEKPTRSKLSAEELRDAGLKSLKNASELIKEARILFKHGCWSRAFFLCCISGEELGKCFITLSAIMNHRAGTFNERRYRERFRTHREKTGSLNFFEDVFVSSSSTPIQPEDITAASNATEEIKLASLYCDFYGTRAQAPSELLTEQLARGALKLAQNRVEHFTKEVRPKFEHALKIDPAEIRRFQNRFLRSMGAQTEQQSDY